MEALFEKFHTTIEQPFWTVALLQTGHGGADEDRPARLAERHAVHL